MRNRIKYRNKKGIHFVMKVKNKLASLLILPVMLLTACGGGAAKNPAPKDVTAAILAEVNMNSAVEKDKSNLSDYYTAIDVSKVEEASFYICASGAYPDEIAVIKLTDAAGAAEAKKAMQSRLDKQIELFSTYTPAEMYKLETAKLYTVGNYAVLLACEDNDKAKEIADKLF